MPRGPPVLPWVLLKHAVNVTCPSDTLSFLEGTGGWVTLTGCMLGWHRQFHSKAEDMILQDNYAR